MGPLWGCWMLSHWVSGTPGRNEKDAAIVLNSFRLWRLPMPNSLQYPMELQRDLERRWGRLLQRTAAPARAPVNAHVNGSGTVSPVTPNPVAVFLTRSHRETPITTTT